MCVGSCCCYTCGIAACFIGRPDLSCGCCALGIAQDILKNTSNQYHVVTTSRHEVCRCRYKRIDRPINVSEALFFLTAASIVGLIILKSLLPPISISVG